MVIVEWTGAAGFELSTPDTVVLFCYDDFLEWAVD